MALLTRQSVAQTAATGSTAAALPQRGDIVIRKAVVMTMDPSLGDVGSGDVHIAGGTIRAVGQNLAAPGATEIDGSGMIALPGFVDTHTHLWSTQMRGRFGDTPEGITTAVDFFHNNRGPDYAHAVARARRDLAIALEQERHDAADLAGRNRGAGRELVAVPAKNRDRLDADMPPRPSLDPEWTLCRTSFNPPARHLNFCAQAPLRLCSLEKKDVA
jgi:hypothetical protein